MDRDGTVLPDGQHQLLVYKVEDPSRLKDASSYLQLPHSTKQLNALSSNVSSGSMITLSGPTSSLVGTPPFQRNPRESVTVAFYLCSTKLTQNGIIVKLKLIASSVFDICFPVCEILAHLLSLLKWKSHPERISETLSLVMRLRGEELVKFLQDVLDSLFAMFSTEDGNATQHSGLVFEVLVSLAGLWFIKKNKLYVFLGYNPGQHFELVGG